MRIIGLLKAGITVEGAELQAEGNLSKLHSGFFHPLNGKSAKLFRNFFLLRGLEMMFLDLIRLKMDHKGHMIDQKGLKMYEKSQKMEFSDLTYLF